MALIRLICYPPYLVLECWLEIVNSNELETITQAEIYESAKILQDLAKVKPHILSVQGPFTLNEDGLF